MPMPMSRPLRYEPSFEVQEENEPETTAALVDTMRSIVETTYKDYGRAVRSAHAKSHGILRGTLQILDGLPDSLRQGVFAKPRNHPVVMRLSTSPGDLLDDSVSTPRGLAIQISEVDGERLAGSEGRDTQDFVLVNGPVFAAANQKAFLKNLKLLAASTDKAQGLKKAFSAALRGAETVVETFGSKSPTLNTLGGQPETHILGETFFSQVPFLYGPYMAKIAVAPISPNLTALTDAPLDVNGKPNGLREAVVAFFKAQGSEWEVRVQLCTDLESMPIEDASVEWPQDKSPYVAVARITVEAQDAWNESNSSANDAALAFSPWYGLAAHRPLGSINRARKPAYRMSADFRSKHRAMPLESVNLNTR